MGVHLLLSVNYRDLEDSFTSLCRISSLIKDLSLLA